jgi:hypothetical protein
MSIVQYIEHQTGKHTDGPTVNKSESKNELTIVHLPSRENRYCKLELQLEGPERI